MKKLDAVWLAAMIDGEGSVGIYKRSNGRSSKRYLYPQISIGNTYKPIVDRCEEVSKVGFIHTEKSNYYRKKRYYHWRVQNQRDAVKIAKAILPYLIIEMKKTTLRKIIKLWG